MEDCPSENRCPSQPQPKPECPPPRPSTCRAITIERSRPAGCSTKSKANKNKLQSFSSNECPSSASSKPKLEQPASSTLTLELPASSKPKLEQPASSKPKLEQPASSKPKLEQTAKIKPPPPPPLSKPTTPPEVKPIPELPPSNTQRYSFPPSATEKLQSVVAAHKKTVATLQCAARDLFCRANTSTHEAIIIISNESNKHLQNIKKTVSGIIPEKKEGGKCDPSAAVQKVSDMNLWQFGVVNVDTSKEPGESALTKSQTKINEKINKAWNFVLQNVDSAVSVMSDSLCSMQRKSFNDQSSKYDVPKPRPKEVSCCPDEEEDILWNPGNFYLFSSMKDKVWGLFSDDVKTTLSDDLVASENDDNFINTITD